MKTYSTYEYILVRGSGDNIIRTVYENTDGRHYIKYCKEWAEVIPASYPYNWQTVKRY